MKVEAHLLACWDGRGVAGKGSSAIVQDVTAGVHVDDGVLVREWRREGVD